ncbi:MAG: hypothetical protein SVP52_02635 [Chloroflexota bacterium]|nr:hypothetical protein [Chloroflexota bacterium]
MESFLPFPFTTHKTLLTIFKQKTPSRQGRRFQRRGTTLLPGAQISPDSLGRDNVRWTSLVVVFTSAICSVLSWQGEFNLFWRSVPPVGLTLLSPDSLTDGLLLLP